MELEAQGRKQFQYPNDPPDFGLGLGDHKGESHAKTKMDSEITGVGAENCRGGKKLAEDRADLQNTRDQRDLRNVQGIKDTSSKVDMHINQLFGLSADPTEEPKESHPKEIGSFDADDSFDESSYKKCLLKKRPRSPASELSQQDMADAHFKASKDGVAAGMNNLGGVKDGADRKI